MIEMGVLIPLAALLVFEVAAWFWGVDSREWSTGRSTRPARAI